MTMGEFSSPACILQFPFSSTHDLLINCLTPMGTHRHTSISRVRIPFHHHIHAAKITGSVATTTTKGRCQSRWYLRVQYSPQFSTNRCGNERGAIISVLSGTTAWNSNLWIVSEKSLRSGTVVKESTLTMFCLAAPGSPITIEFSQDGQTKTVVVQQRPINPGSLRIMVPPFEEAPDYCLFAGLCVMPLRATMLLPFHSCFEPCPHANVGSLCLSYPLLFPGICRPFPY